MVASSWLSSSSSSSLLLLLLNIYELLITTIVDTPPPWRSDPSRRFFLNAHFASAKRRRAEGGPFVVLFCAPLSHESAASPVQWPPPSAFNYHFARTSQAKSWFLAATSATRKPTMIQEAPLWRLGAPRWPQKGPVQSATNTVLQTKSKRYFHDLPDLAQPQSFEGSPKPFAHFYLYASHTC